MFSVFHQISGKLTKLGLQSSYQQTLNYARIKARQDFFFRFLSCDKVCTSWLPFHKFQKTSGSEKKIHGNTTDLV